MITIETVHQTFLQVEDAWDGYSNTLEITLSNGDIARVPENEVVAVNGAKVSSDIEFHLYELLDQCFA